MSKQLDHYLKGFIPEPFTILGLPLRDFSLGHLFLMQRFNCAFCTDDPNSNASIDDLRLACLICAHSFDEFLDFVNNSVQMKWYEKPWQTLLNHIWFERTLKPVKGVFIPWVSVHFGSTFSYRWLSRWDRALRKMVKGKDFNVLETFQLFNKYRSYGLKVPSIWNEPSGNASKSGAHWSQNVFAVLTSKLGYSDHSALNMPLGRAFTEYFKYLESNGQVTFKDDNDIAETEALAKEDK